MRNEISPEISLYCFLKCTGCAAELCEGVESTHVNSYISLTFSIFRFNLLFSGGSCTGVESRGDYFRYLFVSPNNDDDDDDIWSLRCNKNTALCRVHLPVCVNEMTPAPICCCLICRNLHAAGMKMVSAVIVCIIEYMQLSTLSMPLVNV